jgi:hypothetical protein
VNPTTCAAGDAFEEGEYCNMVLAVDDRGRMPVQEDFFKGKAVGPDDRKKMHSALRNFSRTGPTSNTARYKSIDGVHYLKIHGFRAYCIERNRRGTREVVVCHIESKKEDKALPDNLTDKAWRLFQSHCGRFP